MTCRHGPYDPNCGSYRSNIETLKTDYSKQILGSITPDASKFEVEDAEQVGAHLVLKVRYPNCASCSYEGSKVMVFLDATLSQAIKWKTIDPHFRDPTTELASNVAPGPNARFPATASGMVDAKQYAMSKNIGWI